MVFVAREVRNRSVGIVGVEAELKVYDRSDIYGCARSDFLSGAKLSEYVIGGYIADIEELDRKSVV